MQSEEKVIGCWVGIDVSKDSLDVAVLTLGSDKPVHRKVDNKRSGFEEMKVFVEELVPLSECHFCMESTGPYGRGVATYLSVKGALVSVENPRFIKYFAMGKRFQQKTDKADAKIIASYCKQEAPRPWTPLDPSLRELDELLKRLKDIEKLRVQEANRGESKDLPQSALDSIARTLAFFKAETKAIQEGIEATLKKLPKIREMVDVLVREPGIGELTALRFLSHVSWTYETFESAQQCAAAAGYNPKRRESGTMVGHTRISKHGDASFRASMHLVAVTATRCNPKVEAFYLKRLEGGMAKLAAITACSRKLVMILFGILKAHAQGRTPVYSAEKPRYLTVTGTQRTFLKKDAA